MRSTASEKAKAAAKLKRSSGAVKQATKMAAAFDAAKQALQNAHLSDFDTKLQPMALL
jgi:uncharacterized protein GlcG (DUF336 family)